jgi:hypothetical protein
MPRTKEDTYNARDRWGIIGAEDVVETTALKLAANAHPRFYFLFIPEHSANPLFPHCLKFAAI